MLAPRILIACGLFGGMACSDPPPPAGPELTSVVEQHERWWFVNRQFDVLFVVDNSPAMTPHLARVRDNFSRYMQVLESIPGGLPDLHIGVVTGCTSGSQGALQTNGAPVVGTYLSDVRQPDDSRLRNYTGSLASVFTQMASVGDQGCTPQRPLEAIKQAFSNPANAGFLRLHAYLVVVVVSASDDSSANAIESYAQFLRSVKPDPLNILALAITGPSDPIDPSCAAQPANRLHAFLAQFPNRSSEASICAEDTSAVLSLLPQLIKVALTGPPCWERMLADVDLDTPGPQYDCAARIHSASYEANLPACNAGALPCYEITLDPTNCTTGSHQSVRFHPTYQSVEPARVFIECIVE